MSPDLFFQVVVPLMGVRNTALLAITTPQDEFNYFTELMNLKDQWGEHLFLCIKLGMICKACAKNNTACTHRLNMNPDWKPIERTQKVDAMSISMQARACVATELYACGYARACVF